MDFFNEAAHHYIAEDKLNAIKTLNAGLKVHAGNEDMRKLAEEFFKKLEEEQKQKQQKQDKQQKDQQNKEQNKDQQNSEQKKEQQNKEQQNKEQKNKEQQNKEKQNKEQQQSSQKGEGKESKEVKLSEKQAIKNLDAINNDEEKILLKVNRKKGSQKKKNDNVKDW